VDVLKQAQGQDKPFFVAVGLVSASSTSLLPYHPHSYHYTMPIASTPSAMECLAKVVPSVCLQYHFATNPVFSRYYDIYPPSQIQLADHNQPPVNYGPAQQWSWDPESGPRHCGYMRTMSK
jgi:hypothetical protein